MSTQTTVNSITIIGRRWFQKLYGNTYHSAEIHLNGEFYASTGKHYGYGEQFLTTAMEQLAKDGIVDWKRGTAPTIWARENGISMIVSASDVRREKDL